MRVCLFWNEAAGEGISLDELSRDIASAGHQVARVIEKNAELPPCIDGDVDLVAAAGGDGTIARAGRALAGTHTPLAMLPLGTANNIATSLGIQGEPAELIAQWSKRRPVRMDIGRATGNGRSLIMLESVGFGLVAEAIAAASGTLAKGDPEAHLAEARQLYVDVLDRLHTARYDLIVDGESLPGDYLLIEVLNTPSIGPGLRLTTDVNAADGRFSVVALTERDRPALKHYLESLKAGSIAPAPFKSWFATRVSIAGPGRMHVDDRVEDITVVEIDIEAASLPVLA